MFVPMNGTAMFGVDEEAAGLLVGVKRNHTNVDEDVSVISETMDSEFAME